MSEPCDWTGRYKAPMFDGEAGRWADTSLFGVSVGRGAGSMGTMADSGFGAQMVEMRFCFT